MRATALPLYCTIWLSIVSLACSDQPALGASATVMPTTSVSEVGPMTAATAGERASAGASGTAGSTTTASQAGAAAAPSTMNAGSGQSTPGDAPAPNDNESDAGISDQPAQPPAADSGMPSTSDSGMPTTVVCPATAARPGETKASLQHDGRTREYLTYVPNGYDPKRPWPLILNFHGATMTAEQQRDFSAMNAAADAKGFVVVYPQGVGNSWNAGVCCGEAQSSNVDDVGFVRELLAAVQASVCVDPRRIYSSGFSNGGRMTYRLGCELTDTFAALASVAGTKSFPDDQNTPGCMPSKAISMIDFMGSADPRSAAQPGQIMEWVAFNGCTDTTPMESYRQGPHACSTYSQCENGTSVTSCVVEDGDHCWPGAYPCILGNTSRPEELSANELIWKLFERSTR